MANIVKIKIALCIVSVIIMAGVPLLRTKFFAKSTTKRWGTLTWEDFKGIPTVLGSYDAAIRSQIFLEYDSAKSKMVAYAGQDDIGSYVRDQSIGSETLLRHEQYHFNITEVFSRKLNEYIAKNPRETLYNYTLRLNSLSIDLDNMQADYDFETKHGGVTSAQAHWEYRIDSLLSLDSGWVVDQFSGGKVFFPAKPVLLKGVEKSIKYRGFELYLYDMTLGLYSYQSDGYSRNVLKNIRANRERNGLKMQSLQSGEKWEGLISSYAYKDSSGYTVHDTWFTNFKHLINLKARYPNTNIDTTGYHAIVRSFTNSFEVINSDEYWITRANSRPPKKPMAMEKYQGFKREDITCIHRGVDHAPIFSRIIYREDGIYIAFNQLTHPDSLLYEDVVWAGKEMYSYEPASDGQVHFAPRSSIPKGGYSIDYGYVLLQDSVKECYEFYRNTVDLVPIK
jgi:hypothetical protein